MTPTRYLKRAIFALCLIGLATHVVLSFPPAPDHVVFGMVRDELGNPLPSSGAQLLLETTSGVVLKASIVPGLRPGANYRSSIPMDSRITATPYLPTALEPTVPFRIKVRIGPTTYLPIEMSGDYARIGRPGAETRIDLTLGEDSDGDGLPDAWERALAAKAGLSNSQIDPNEDFDHDGLSNLNEYLAGTYAYDPADGFTLSLSQSGTNSIVQFVAVRGRSYSILGSASLQEWNPAAFRLPADEAGVQRLFLQATNTTLIQASINSAVGNEPFWFFKLIVQ